MERVRRLLAVIFLKVGDEIWLPVGDGVMRQLVVEQ